MADAVLPKKKIFDHVNELVFDKLRARFLPNGNVALSDPDTGKDMVILHKWVPKHEMIELLFDEVPTPLGTVFFDKESYLQHKNSKGIYYSPQWADLFCSQIYDGENITDICKAENMPPYQMVCQWRQMYPEFEQKVVAAFEARGERHRDQVANLSKKMYEDNDPESYMIAKVHIENQKWLASKDNAKRFSNHVEVHNTTAPVTLRVETGVDYNKYRTVGGAVKELTGEIADNLEKEKS